MREKSVNTSQYRDFILSASNLLTINHLNSISYSSVFFLDGANIPSHESCICINLLFITSHNQLLVPTYG